MVDTELLLSCFEQYARSLLRPFDVGTALYRLTDDVIEVLGVDGAGVCLADASGRLAFVTASDAATSRVEEAQVALDEGPCQQAYATGEQVTITDLESETRWPDYLTTARTTGFRSIAGLPMPLAEDRIGALNLYARDPRAWDGATLRVGQVLADMATGYVVSTNRFEQSETRAEQLQRALESRVVIEQAKGIIAERRSTSTSAAFDRLRSHARSNGVSLHEVCRSVVDGTLDV